MIYVTGDIHGDVTRFCDDNMIREGIVPSKEDVFIVCGHFGIPFGEAYKEADEKALKFLYSKPYKICFVDGCHENHFILSKLKTSRWNGGLIGLISPNVFYMKRGELFNLQGKTIFTFGGGESPDKKQRREGINWWSTEKPSLEEYKHGARKLILNGHKVDYVITHTPPASFDICANEVTENLSIYKERITYKQWYCGNLHVDKTFHDFHAVYQKFIRLE